MALIDVALNSETTPVQAQQVAAREGIPKQYLDQLMLVLKNAGFLASSRGRQGGYSLARPARDITLLQVVTALEGPVGNANFLPKGRRRLGARGALKAVWDDLWSRSLTVLRHKTLEDVCKACRAEEQAPMYHI